MGGGQKGGVPEIVEGEGVTPGQSWELQAAWLELRQGGRLVKRGDKQKIKLGRRWDRAKMASMPHYLSGTSSYE